MTRVDITDYGYVNARVRAMRAYLLTKEFFMRLVEAEDFEALHSLLEQTIYRREVNEALLMDPERPDYDLAFSLNLVAALRKIKDATGGEAHRLVNLLLSRYDLLNVKTVLRGKHGEAAPADIMSTLVPVGEISMEDLETMVRENNVMGIVEFMMMNGIRYASPLEAAMQDFIKKNQDLSVLELALDKYHYRTIMDQLKGRRRNTEMVRRMFLAEIDMRNISTLVRIRGIRLDDDEVKNLMLPAGTLTADQFLELDRLGDIVTIVSEYPDPQYKKVLEKALAEYQEIDVVAFDRELERRLAQQGAAMSNVDVLGIGVIIGYMWLKDNEIVNLRLVLKGKLMEKSETAIQGDLFFVEDKEGEAA